MSILITFLVLLLLLALLLMGASSALRFEERSGQSVILKLWREQGLNSIGIVRAVRWLWFARWATGANGDGRPQRGARLGAW